MNGIGIGRYAASVVLVVAVAMGGCKSAPKPAPTVNAPNAPEQGTLNPNGTFTPNAVQPGQQGTLNSDGTFTPNGTAPAQSAMAPAPATAPAPAPATTPLPSPAPVLRTIPAGTSVAVTITESLSASHNNVGDGFSGVLAQTVSSGGAACF